MKLSLQSVLLLAVLPFSAAFVSQPSTGASALKTATPSKSELGAWHDHSRRDPYLKNANGEVNILKSDYYNQRDRVGGMMQPYSYNNYQWGNSNSYSGPYSNSETAVSTLFSETARTVRHY